MREKFEAIEAHWAKCGRCGKHPCFMKPSDIDYEALNEPSIANNTSLFYICFSCSNIIQVGFGQVSSLKYMPCLVNNSLSKGDKGGQK